MRVRLSRFTEMTRKQKCGTPAGGDTVYNSSSNTFVSNSLSQLTEVTTAILAFFG